MNMCDDEMSDQCSWVGNNHPGGVVEPFGFSAARGDRDPIDILLLLLLLLLLLQLF